MKLMIAKFEMKSYKLYVEGRKLNIVFFQRIYFYTFAHDKLYSRPIEWVYESIKSSYGGVHRTY